MKVVSPYGEIPWNDMSRISDEEMKALMIEIVDRVFTAIQDNPDNPKVGLRLPSGWNAPEISEGMIYKGEMVTALQKYSQTEFVGFTDRMVQGSEVWD